jgi:hypothetical protein
MIDLESNLKRRPEKVIYAYFRVCGSVLTDFTLRELFSDSFFFIFPITKKKRENPRIIDIPS